jgi:cytochrome c-type biogenesis protein CcmH
MRIAAAILLFWLVSSPALAVTPDEQLANPALEARAVKISQELRCVVCQNQTIDDSDAALAHDLRVILRERISAGDSDTQAIDYIVQRYGHHVLLRPPLEFATLALWFGPLVTLVLGGLGVAGYWRARQSPGLLPLDAEQKAELERLLNSSELK